MAGRKGDEAIGMGAWVFALLAVLLAMAATFVAGRALDRSDDANARAAEALGTPVSLSEFKIDPQMISAGEGATLTVRNTGAVTHNLAVRGTDLTTPDLSPGESATLGVGDLKEGVYTVFCTIPGHAASGMEGMLHLGAGAIPTGGGGVAAELSPAANERVDAQQKKPVDAFVGQLEQGPNTKGVGGVPLEPTVLPDGTKEFTLTASVVDWEVEPGKVVQAWAYNGMVPGPTIHVQPGDRVRVVLDNQLAQSTSIHWHGVDVPNAMDGVPFVTQPPVKPGEQFVYEFTAQGPAVGMYHSHHHGEHQVPDGLLGAFLVGEMPLPAGVTVSQELPMVLNDAGAIGLSLNGKSFPATAPMITKLGDWVEIHYMNEGLQVHPMHLHGMPQLVIAKDGLPVPTPYQEDTVLVGPGERYTVLVNATEPGVWAWHCHILNHAEREDGMFGMVTVFVVQ